MGYCLDQKRAKIEKSIGPDGKEVKIKTCICRFNHPMEINGFDYTSDVNGKLQHLDPKLDGNGGLEINGSFYHDGSLKGNITKKYYVFV